MKSWIFALALLFPISASAQIISPLGMQCAGDLQGNAPNCIVVKTALGGSRNINMNSTADQTITLPTFAFPYYVTSVLLTNCTATPSLAVGGIYTGSGKTGTQLVQSSQTYSALTTAGYMLNIPVTLTAVKARFLALR
jgi:hypothetical protein